MQARRGVRRVESRRCVRLARLSRPHAARWGGRCAHGYCRRCRPPPPPAACRLRPPTQHLPCLQGPFGVRAVSPNRMIQLFMSRHAPGRGASGAATAAAAALPGCHCTPPGNHQSNPPRTPGCSRARDSPSSGGGFVGRRPSGRARRRPGGVGAAERRQRERRGGAAGRRRVRPGGGCRLRSRQHADQPAAAVPPDVWRQHGPAPAGAD